MFKQAQSIKEMSPTKPSLSCQTPNAVHVLSTPAHFSKSGSSSGVPPLNWDESMIGESSMMNKSEENKEPIKRNETFRKSRRKPVPICSKYMQSAAKRKAPPAGNWKTSSTSVGQTEVTNSMGIQQKIDELNHEDTFIFEKKDASAKTNSKITRPTASKSVMRPAIKQSSYTERKTSRVVSKHTSTTSKLGKSAVHSLSDCSGEEGRISSSEVGHGSKDPKTLGVSEAELHVLENQKLQMLHLLSRLESTQDSLSEEASCQMYQMWKVQENLRSECNVLELDCLVKEYICEVNDLSQSLLPGCAELSESLPKFDEQFVTLYEMLDSTRHYLSTVKISRFSDHQVEQLRDSLRQLLALLNRSFGEKAKIVKNVQELTRLKTCFEDSSHQYELAAQLIQKIKSTTDENLFLISTFNHTCYKEDR